MTEAIIRRVGGNFGTTLIEVLVGDTNGTYKLPDDSILRDKRIIGAFVPDNSDNTAKSPTGRSLASNEAVRSTYLTLKHNNDEVLMDHPLSDFLQESGDRVVRMLDLCNMNPQKSEITVGDTSLITAGESFLIQFIYEK